MSKLRYSSQQRAAILRAASDARERGPIDPSRYDAVDLASDTRNEWYSLGRLGNRECETALRLIHSNLRRGRRP